MGNFLKSHPRNQNRSSIPKKHDPLAKATAAKQEDKLLSKLREEEKEKAKRQNKLKALSERETQFIPLTKK